MIERLSWDTAFFGYPVGSTFVNESFDYASFIKESAQYKLVYLFSDKYLSMPRNIPLMDQKVVLTKQWKTQPKAMNVVEFQLEQHSFPELESLALQSGKYSRFYTDSGFCQDEFGRLYRQWIKNAVQNNETKVFVKLMDLKIAGLITLDLEKQNASIGLVAVDKEFRGRKIGSELLDQISWIADLYGYKEVSVRTQFQNQPAMQLYHKNGFVISSTSFVYHYWNHDTLQ